MLLLKYPKQIRWYGSIRIDLVELLPRIALEYSRVWGKTSKEGEELEGYGLYIHLGWLGFWTSILICDW